MFKAAGRAPLGPCIVSVLLGEGGLLIRRKDGQPWPSNQAKRAHAREKCVPLLGSAHAGNLQGLLMGFENGDLDSTLRTIYPIRDSVAVKTDHGAAGGHRGHASNQAKQNSRVVFRRPIILSSHTSSSSAHTTTAQTSRPCYCRNSAAQQASDLRLVTVEGTM